MSSIRYRPEIDGLRTVAVMAVILFHLGYDWIPGGYLGVDVFFVISGYLITSIILRELDQGRFSFKNFWARRIRRIMPALLAVTAFTMAVVYFWGFKAHHPITGTQALAALLSYSNIYYWKFTGDYWGPTAEESPFLHTWSLAVEEQFYLFLPLLIFAIYKYKPNRILSALICCVLASLGLFMFAHDWKPTAAFYLLPPRAWELGAGCILAAIHRKTPPTDSRFAALGLLGLGMVLLGYLFIPVLGPSILIPVLGATLIIAFGNHGLCRKLLANKSMVGVGKISYSLYLWHWPLIVLPKQFDMDMPLVAYAPLTLAAALASYYLVEKSTRNRTWTVPASLTTCGVCVAVAATFVTLDNRYKVEPYGSIDFSVQQYDLRPYNNITFNTDYATFSLPERAYPKDTYATAGYAITDPPSFTEKPKVVLLGDSHALMWSNTIHNMLENASIEHAIACMNGTTPFFTVPATRQTSMGSENAQIKLDFDKKTIANIQGWKPDLVILATRWSGRTEETNQIESTLDFLASHCKQVLLIGSPPELGFGDRLCVEYMAYKHMDPQAGKLHMPVDAANLSRFNEGKEIAKSQSQRHSNVTFLPIDQCFLEENQILVYQNHQTLYWDDDHLTEQGVSLAAPLVNEAIQELLNDNDAP